MPVEPASPFGALLRQWRQTRRMSQEALAHDAEVSARHVSFLDTGRSRPSAEMVLVLGSALAVPLRDRNALLAAAGHPPAYRETDLADPALATVRQALDFLLERHEPYPAFVLDHRWRVLDHNAAAAGMVALLGQVMPDNALVWTFDPAGLRPMITNWDTYASEMLRRVQRDATIDPAAGDLLARLLALGHPPTDWRRPRLRAPAPLVPLELRLGDQRLSLFTTITTLGTAQDITLTEVRVETIFPADAEIADTLATLLRAPHTPHTPHAPHAHMTGAPDRKERSGTSPGVLEEVAQVAGEIDEVKANARHQI